MTEEELVALILEGQPKVVLERLAAMPEADRQKIKTKPLEMYRKRDPQIFAEGNTVHNDRVDQLRALQIAVLGTITLEDARKFTITVDDTRKLRALPEPKFEDITFCKVAAALRLSWLQAWVDENVGRAVYDIHFFGPLFKNGLCEMPDNDMIILGYYSMWFGTESGVEGATPEFLNKLIWRFFEVEGSGEFSLAAHDKYQRADRQWSTFILGRSKDGTLDRQRLLDESLATLARDFAQFRGGWYMRLHTALNATPEEEAARKGAYLGLLSSTIPPTVSFAIKTVARLDKAGQITTPELLEHIEPALMARTKTTATAALRLLGAAVKRSPDQAEEIALMATRALVHEQADVQSKALDLVEKLGPLSTSVVEELAQYQGLLAPSLQPRLTALAGIEVDAEVAPEVVVEPMVASPIAPIENPEDTLRALLEVLENQRDPFLIERAMDGLMRHGAALLERPDDLSPLRKRSAQIVKRAEEADTARVIAHTVSSALTDGAALQLNIHAYPATHLLSRRNHGIVQAIRRGVSLPLLSAPSDTSGGVLARDLVDRLSAWDKAEETPIVPDLALALSRLSPERAGVSVPDNNAEHWQALAYALGGSQTPGEIAEIWSAAWSSRLPLDEDLAIAALYPGGFPNTGTLVALPPKWTRVESSYEGSTYSWPALEQPFEAGASKSQSEALWPIPSFCFCRWFPMSESLGHNYAEVAWAALLHPWRVAPFFAAGMQSCSLDSKLSDNPSCAYLEPCFRPGPELGPTGANMLAYFLASTDTSVSSLAIEAICAAVEQERLTAGELSVGIRALMDTRTVPLKRWRKTLEQAAQRSERLAEFVLESLGVLFSEVFDEEPKDLGSLLELMYELNISAGSQLADPKLRAGLSAIKSGGKARTYVKRLLATADVVG